VTRIARTLSLLIALALMAGCTSQPSARLDSLKTPQSPLQLVEAIWQLSASGQILDTGLYTADNLKRAFGGSDVNVRVGKYDVLIGSYWAEIRDFPFETPPRSQTSLSIQRLTLHPERSAAVVSPLEIRTLPYNDRSGGTRKVVREVMDRGRVSAAATPNPGTILPSHPIQVWCGGIRLDGFLRH